MIPLSQRLLAEVLGTLLLLATVVGSGIMGETLAAGNDAVALLGNTLATAAILYVLITVFGPLSGAHFNPAVTLFFAALGEIKAAQAVLYLCAQVVGAILGVVLAHAMFELPLLQEGVKLRSGWGQWIAEATATFGLLMTILGTRRARPEAIPTAVALYITAGYWFTASTSFANPAVTLARSFTDSFSGIQFVDAPGFWLAQLSVLPLAWMVAKALGWLQRH